MEQLAELVARAKAVPLTDFIRINRRKAYERLDAIRQALDADEAPR